MIIYGRKEVISNLPNMLILKKFSILLLLPVILFSMAYPVYAGHRIAGISGAKARKVVSKVEDGEITKVKEKKGIYEISVTKADGSVKAIYIDAATGKVIKKMPVSLAEATSSALKEVPGKVVNVKFNKAIYEIYIKTDKGIVKEVYVNARTGQILNIKIEK